MQNRYIFDLSVLLEIAHGTERGLAALKILKAPENRIFTSELIVAALYNVLADRMGELEATKCLSALIESKYFIIKKVDMINIAKTAYKGNLSFVPASAIYLAQILDAIVIFSGIVRETFKDLEIDFPNLKIMFL